MNDLMKHTVKAFSDELEKLSADVSVMGGLAENAVASAMQAVINRDAELAEQVIEADGEIDRMQREIEKQIIRLLALRQPMASDLRSVIAALKIVADLERTGDLAKSIARRTRVLVKSDPLPLTPAVERMGLLVQGHLHQVLDAYATGETASAVGVWERDEDVDEHYNALFRDVIAQMMEDPSVVGPGAHLLFVAKNLERIGDHATNIAEVIHYVVTGNELKGERPRGPRPELPE